MSGEPKALEIDGAVRRFGRVTALDGITFSVAPGEIVALVGPNGAGKSTLLAAGAGLLPLHAGRLRCAGHPPGGRQARRAVGYAAESPCPPRGLTVGEVLAYAARLHAGSPACRQLVAEAIELGGLAAVARQRASRLSRGFAQRLALALATLGDRRLVLLDETLSGIDALTRRALRHRLLGLAGRGVAILLASHDLGVLERLVTRVVILAGGRVRRLGPIGELLGERVLEIVPEPDHFSRLACLGETLTGARATAAGLEVDLGPDHSPEQIMALCRARRIAVRATMVRLRSLEDVVLQALESA